jgi:PAS domain S-box-containing protein
MTTRLRVLILEDRPADAELTARELRQTGFEVDWQRVDTEADYLAHLDPPPDIVLADYSLPQWDAPRALRALQERGLDIPFIMISGTVGEDVAVECIKQGAADYLLKDRLGRLGQAVIKALEDRRLREEKRQAEEELKRLKEFNENIVQSMAEGIALQNAEGDFTFVNPAAAAIMGYSPDELVGQDWTAFIPPDQHPVVRAADERRRRGETDRYEVDLARKDGTRRTVLVSASPRFAEGRFAGTLAVFSDITKRRQAEAALRESEQRLRTVLQNMPVMLDALDENLNIIVWNRECERVTGYSADEIIRHPDVSELLYPDPRYREQMQAHLVASDDYRDWEWGTTCKDGSVRTIAWSNISRQYPVPGWTRWGIGVDITERKRAEEALRRRDALLEALAYLSEQLLRSTDLDAVLPDALARLGVAARVSRAHIFENHTAPDGTLLTSCRYEWVTPDPATPTTSLSLQNVAYEDDFARWVDLLSQGRPIYGIVRELPARERAALETQGIFSQATVPIFAGEEWWGFLGFDDCEREREWLPVEIEALRNVASAFGAALIRQRAEKAEREQRILAEALSDTAATLTSALEFDTVLDRILRTVGRVVPHDSASIMLLEGDHIRMAAWDGYEADLQHYLEDHSYPLATVPFLDELRRSRAPLLVPDTRADPAWADLPPRQWILSFIALPIQAYGQVIGFLTLESRTPGFFTPDHVQRLRAFADQVSIAIEHAQLYEEARRHADELQQRVEERTAQLNHAKERTEAILNSSNDVMILCHPDGTIDQVNPAFSDTFGRISDEVYNQPLAQLVIPEHVSFLEQTFKTVAQTRQPERLEVTARYQERAAFDADIVLSPVVGQDERLLGVVCSLRDITVRKQMEAQLRQMLQREMELSELKTRYVAMAAHDLRNPLAVIQSAVDLVQRYRDRLTEEQTQSKYNTIHDSIQVMTNLLDDILTMGQVESGKLKFDPKPLDLIAFCRNLAAELEQAAAATQRIAFVHTGSRDPVYMDPKLLRHVLSNLLSNAIKYSPVGTAVRFEARAEPDTITFDIQDQGIGIPKADQARLFEAFHRASNARHIRGTGLGLAIAQQSVELHGGTITVESEEGVGTTFTVILPQASAGQSGGS